MNQIRPVFMPRTEELFDSPEFQQLLLDKKDLIHEGKIITKLSDITEDEWVLFRRMPEEYQPAQVREFIKKYG